MMETTTSLAEALETHANARAAVTLAERRAEEAFKALIDRCGFNADRYQQRTTLQLTAQWYTVEGRELYIDRGHRGTIMYYAVQEGIAVVLVEDSDIDPGIGNLYILNSARKIAEPTR